MAGSGILPICNGDLNTTGKKGCCCLVSTAIISSLIIFITYMANYAHLGPDDQVRIRVGRSYEVINGPAATQLNPFRGKEYRKAVGLDPLHYCVVQDRLTGIRRHVEGPQLFFMGPDDEYVATEQKMILERDQYIRFVDRLTGRERVLRGPQAIVPTATEFSQDGVQRSVFLTMDRAVIVLNKTSGMQRLVTSCNHESGVFAPDETEDVLAEREIVHVLPHEAMVVRDVLGVVTIYSGRSSNTMQGDGQCVMSDSQEAGGGTAFFLPPYDRIVRMQWSSFSSPEAARAVRTTTAPATTDIHTSTDAYYAQPTTTARAITQTTMASGGAAFGSARYVMPMYVDQEVPSQHSGPKRRVVAIDLRVQKSFYSYEVRSNDNVPLRIEGTIFWEIGSVATMINRTADPEGDTWQKCRSGLVSVVSQKTLQQLMANFSAVTYEAEVQLRQDTFFSERGINMLSMEMTKFQPVDQATADVLQNIIRQTTQRINDLQKQQSENDVRREKLLAEIALEANRTLLIETQARNARLEAEALGATQGGRVAGSINAFMENLNETVPSVEGRLELFTHQAQLNSSKVDAINLAAGNASLYLAPSDMELRLQMPHQGEM